MGRRAGLVGAIEKPLARQLQKCIFSNLVSTVDYNRADGRSVATGGWIAPLKAKTSVLQYLRDTFQSFARAMIGRSGC